ncbi:MAG TPA: aldolase/citrate lyase family protein [Acidimicrobiales bacterium]|nr:aldolase/citrate lyase family protein [Acidimicrobiales bacterium]
MSGLAFRARVRAGERVVATFCKLESLESVDLVAAAGFDAVVVDLEHSQIDDAAASRLIRHATALGLAALARVPSVDAGLVNRLLEAGAAGVQLSSVRRVAQVEALRAALRYAPEGTRSVSSAHLAAGYGRVALGEYLAEQRKDPPLLIGQIETATTDDPLGDIVAGLDVAFVGTTDLSVDLGEPGAVDHPRVAARIAEIAEAAALAGVGFGGFAGGPAGYGALVEQGARYVVYGSDLQLLREALLAAGAQLRAGGRREGP